VSEREFELHYPDGPHIHRGLTEATMRRFASHLEIKIRDVGTGWVWYRLPTFLDGTLGIGVDLGFNHGRLEQLTLFHDDPAIYGEDWSDCSEKEEKLRAETTHSWLRAKGFQIGRHSWGEVWSHYDAKSGFGAGGVRYAS
jgi:hypothetical protein